jgi:hypothetical protein
MTEAFLTKWEHMLDEFVCWPNPQTWYDATELRMPRADQYEAVAYLVRLGYIEVKGLRRHDFQNEVLYGPTELGMRYWRNHLSDGQRRRPRAARPIPATNTATDAVRSGPRDAWSLAEIQWIWKREENDE